MAGTLTVQNLQGPSSGANANKVIIPSGQTFIPSSGQIIQTVQFLRAGSTSGSSGSAVTVTSATYTDVMSKAITTTVANSKIRVMVNMNSYQNTGANTRCAYKVLRDSTEIDGNRYGYYATGINYMFAVTVDHIDSPSAAAGTTLTYKVQGSSIDSETVYFMYSDSGGASTNAITLQEIAP